MSLSRIVKDEYQRRELYNIFYELNENTQFAVRILNTCKPCKKKAQEAGLSTDQVEPEKMELLIKGFQCYINAIDEAKQKIEALGYGVDTSFNLQAYNDECVKYFEAEREKLHKENEFNTFKEPNEWDKAVNEIVARYNEAMNKEIQALKKKMGIK